MATTPKIPAGTNQAVVAFLDGRRLKGFIYNFSPLNQTFSLFSEGASPNSRGTVVTFKELKAVFFVRDFCGNPDYRESEPAEAPRHGRKIEVTFTDGEALAGINDTYNPQKLGFFIFPLDPQSNNTRIFIINQNVRSIRVG
jgi:hypothetical protein